MAEIKEGILGGIHGKIGPVVGFMWRGRYFLRSTPVKSHKKASEKQILQRTKMSLISSFASKIKDFVNVHYPPVMLNDKMTTGKEQLISMLMKEGVILINKEPCIDISTVLLSIGTLPPAVIKKINRLKTGRIKVAWDNSITNILTKDTDRLTIVAYNEDLDVFSEISSIGKRMNKFVHFDLPAEWTEGNIHFWSVWKSADGKLISTSAYHGIMEFNQDAEVINGEIEIDDVKRNQEKREEEVGSEPQQKQSKPLVTNQYTETAGQLDNTVLLKQGDYESRAVLEELKHNEEQRE